MFVMVVGAKGGVGATTFAYHLARLAGAVPLDAADGSLALLCAGYGKGLDLSLVPQWTRERRGRMAERIARGGQTLLWTPPCAVWAETVWELVEQVENLGHVVADVGLDPPRGIERLVDLPLIVSRDGDRLAEWHERRLKGRWPGARAVVGDLKAAAAAVAEEALGVQAPQSVFDFLKRS